MIEASGIPTVSLSMIPDLTRAVGVPRLAGISYPLSRPLGNPHDADGQRAVLRAMLEVLPRAAEPDTYVELHVTSLDAIHSFWATELGIKADANPGVDNVAYLQTKSPRTFHVRCAELCGLWHGYMFNNGRVVPQAQFTAWVRSQQHDFSAVAKYLPKYSKSYYPDPQRRAG